MRHARGFTFNELVTLLGIGSAALMIAFVVLLPRWSRDTSGHNTTHCATNLSGLYKAMYTYSVTNKDAFPQAGHATSGGAAIGCSAPARRWTTT